MGNSNRLSKIKVFHLLTSTQASGNNMGKANIWLRCITVFLAVDLGGSQALSHSFGLGSADLTPPMIAHAEDVIQLKKAFGPGAPVLRGVFNELKLWPAGTTLTACFYEGDPKFRNLFVATARQWLPATSLKVDF